MPKNKGKGGKNRRRGKKTNFNDEKRELITKEEGQEYGRVTKMLGNGRLLADCYDGKRRMCKIRGNMRKKVWVMQGDLVLLGLRDYQDDKADVMMKFTNEEERRLRQAGELPDNLNIDGEQDDHDEDEMVAFEFDAL